MNNDSEIKVNINTLCVLKFSQNSDLVFVDYESIERLLDNDFEVLKKQFEINNRDAKSILAFVKRHSKLKILLNCYNYCGTLSDAYQGIYHDSSAIESQYPSKFPIHLSKTERDELMALEKEKLQIDLEERLQAYYLATAYANCEQKRLEKTVLAYSHRKVGWGTPQYQLNSHFSVEIKTNFGYGNASYFYTRFKYKDLDIVPFSDWIIYEMAHLFEIIRYSSKHELKNESWIEAMEYSRDACNLSQTDEIAFVRKYVVDECERMVVGIEEFLKEESFRFLTLEKIFTDVHKTGHNLIEFRGEKISGALSFINQIVQFNKIAEIEEFIIRIKNCNKIIQPILLKELLLIMEELDQLYSDLKVLKVSFENLDKRYKLYDILKIELRKKMFKNVGYSRFKIDHEAFDYRFKLENPEYYEFVELYYKKKKEYKALNAQILSLKNTFDNIDKYRKTIKNYFQN